VLLAVFIKGSQVFLALHKLTRELSTVSPTGSIVLTGTSYLHISEIEKLTLVMVASIGIGLVTTTWFIYNRFGRSELVKLEDVRVLDKYDEVNYCMAVQTRPGNGQWGNFTERLCNAPPKGVVTGSTLVKFYFIPDFHLGCADWRAQDQGAGIVVWEDKHNEPIISAWPEYPATSCTTKGSTETKTRSEAREVANRK
jgi:hypothetical protein